MTRIKKTIELGMGVKIFIIIDDGIAVITSNRPDILKKIALQGKKEGKELGWSERTQSWKEEAPGKSSEEIWDILQGYFNIGLIRQKEKVEELKKIKEREDKNGK